MKEKKKRETLLRKEAMGTRSKDYEKIMLPIIIHIFRMLKKYLEFRKDDARGHRGGRPTHQEPQLALDMGVRM